MRAFVRWISCWAARCRLYVSGVDGCGCQRDTKAKNIGADDSKIRLGGCRVGCVTPSLRTTFHTAYPPDQHVRQ